MKRIIIVLCIVAIMVNAGIFVYINVLSSDGLEEIVDDEDDGGDDDITVDPLTFVVQAPPQKVHDKEKYDYYIFAELYSENKTAYERYTITGTGTVVMSIGTPSEAEDGFKQNHNCLPESEVMSFTFVIAIDKSDSDPLSISGTSLITNNAFRDLASKRTMKSITQASVDMDRLPRTPIPVSLDATLRSYPDPNKEALKTLDESIFQEGQEVRLNDSGSYIKPNEDWWMTETYNWTTDSVEKVSGYNTIRINITSRVFYQFMDFSRLVWIAPELPLPAKIWTKMNTSWEDENESGHMILITQRTILNGTEGFSRGDQDIVWTTGASYLTKYPGSEIKSWDLMPQDGVQFADTNFQMSPNGAVDYAKANSEGLQDFLDGYNDEGEVVCLEADYNFTKTSKDKSDPDGKAGTYYWNLTFGLKNQNMENYWRVNQTYNILVREVIEKKPISGYSSTLSIPAGTDRGQRRGSAPYLKSELDSQTLTMASSVAIMKQDEEITSNGFDKLGRLQDDFRYYLSMAALESSNTPSLNIINTLTGIQTPTTKYTWMLQQGTVWESGQTFTAAVDIPTGQLIYVMSADGTQLNTLFD